MIDFKINEKGMLEARGSFTTALEKKRLSEEASAVSSRWQFEILGIVAELLNYRVTITEKGNELVLEAERNGETHPCDYIKVTRRGDVSLLTFEHFKSRRALTLETAKFLALADRLGVKIALGKNEVLEGDPFPQEEHLVTEHKHKGHKH